MVAARLKTSVKVRSFTRTLHAATANNGAAVPFVVV